ncbi:uncharacterized protein V6R79_004153 [Siganus canaliculatus]
METSMNRTDALADIHPCYKVEGSSLVMRSPSAVCVLLLLFLSSLSVLTVCGNLLVIISVIYFKQLHTPTNFFILSLAVADLLVGLLVCPLTTRFSTSVCHHFWYLFCDIRGIFDIFLCMSSLLHLCCISIDRYCAVCQPLTYRTKINDHVVAIMISVSWMVPALIGAGYIIVSIRQENCGIACYMNVFIVHLLTFYLPVLMMLCIYLKIFLVAQRQARSIQSTKSGATVSQTERKATKTLGVVLGVFLLCWTPTFLFITIETFTDNPISVVVTEILNWLTLSNSMLNPFIYAFFYSWFRSAFRMIMSGKIFRDHLKYTLTENPSIICVLLYAFLVLLSLVTTCGNLLVIISIIYFKQLHTPTNYLILSLAVADLLVGVLVFPFSMAVSLSSCLFHEDLFCKIRSSFDISLSTCSILNLCCISVDRYYAVCQPLTYTSKINHCVVVVMILVSWGVSALMGIAVVIAGLVNENCEENCFIDILIANTIGPFLSFYLPVFMMLCIYLKIFLVAQRQARSIQSTKSGATVSKMERKATKTLAVVLGVFLLCWTPFFLCITVTPFINNSEPVAVTETLNWLTLSNSMLNPFIYAFFYSWFSSNNILNKDFENMESEVSVNATLFWADKHPCYETDHLKYTLTENPSIICVLLYAFLVLLSLVTTCGNLLVIISIIYFKQLHTPTNYLILSLAVADLLVGVLVFPFSMAVSLSSCLFHEDLFCKIRSSFDISLSTCSILNLCCISVDRYYAVCQPLTYTSKINHAVVVTMILLSWGISVIIGIGYIIAGVKNDKCEDRCLIDVPTANIIGAILSFYLPVFMMLCIYLKIFLVAQRQARSIQSTKSGATVSKMERKATKTLATVMGVFLLCWCPFFLCMTGISFTDDSVPIAVIETLNWLTLSNSMLNPFIYAFFYSWFSNDSVSLAAFETLNWLALSNSMLNPFIYAFFYSWFRTLLLLVLSLTLQDEMMKMTVSVSC